MPTIRRPTLSQRFFAMAVVVVLATMSLLAAWTGNYVASSIVRGVGETAAASIQSLISRSLDDAIIDGALSRDKLAGLEEAFSVGSTTDSTRLLQLTIRGLDHDIAYQLSSGLRDETDAIDLNEAIDGQVVVELLDLPLAPVSGLPEATTTVLKIYTPLHDPDGQHIVGVAELYFSGRSVLEQQARARTDVWIITALIGFFSLGMIAALVDGTGEVIESHRARLAQNLRRTRELLLANITLQHASDRVRLESNLAGERMLATVGQDIHDGPVQLLTLLILRMGGKPTQALHAANVALAQQALEELRAVSSGLALPELATASLPEAIETAVLRHENLTGQRVGRVVKVKPSVSAPLTARICAYRVVQEGLSNAYKHGDGTEPSLSASINDGWLQIEVVNALGEARPEPTPGGMGLTGMRFRVESQGGHLAIVFEDGRARVTASIPLAERPHVSPSAGL
jgi:signal transduction histidine kinase